MSPSSRHGGVMTLLMLGLTLSGCGSTNVEAEQATLQGANTVAWVGAFCSGLGDVTAEQARVAKTQLPTLQGQKDTSLKVADTIPQAFTNTVHKLTQLGPPAIVNGKQTQDSAISFFTTTAAAVRENRAKLAALDVNDPSFTQKASQLASSGSDTAAAQLQKVTSNGELMDAFRKATECQGLFGTATH